MGCGWVQTGPLCAPTQGELLGFPFLYVRSNAARLPVSVVSDWLRRCEAMLIARNDRLVLAELFSYYTFPVKGASGRA